MSARAQKKRCAVRRAPAGQRENGAKVCTAAYAKPNDDRQPFFAAIFFFFFFFFFFAAMLPLPTPCRTLLMLRCHLIDALLSCAFAIACLRYSSFSPLPPLWRRFFAAAFMMSDADVLTRR